MTDDKVSKPLFVIGDSVPANPGFEPLKDVADPVDLLAEWYEQWAGREDMPNKMGDGLHIRTMMVLMGHGRIDPETAGIIDDGK